MLGASQGLECHLRMQETDETVRCPVAVQVLVLAELVDRLDEGGGRRCSG